MWVGLVNETHREGRYVLIGVDKVQVETKYPEVIFKHCYWIEDCSSIHNSFDKYLIYVPENEACTIVQTNKSFDKINIMFL